MIDINKEYELLEKISFERLGGSNEELQAANTIIEYLKQDGIEGHIEEFEVDYSDIKKAYLEILEPYNKVYECSAYAGSKNTDPDGMIVDLQYLESDHEVSIKMCKDKAVIYDGYVGLKGYKAIKKSKAKAFIAANGNLSQDYELNHPELRSYLSEDYNIPGVHVVAKDLDEMIALGASKAKIIVLSEDTKHNSRNVVCDIKGEEDDLIVFTAHYDSVEHSTGAYDNGTGSVCIYEIAKYFNKHKPLHSLRFVWCGSEERGLLGSKAYVKDHEEELENVKLNINIDMVGNNVGRPIAVSTADNSLVNYVDYFGKEVGYPVSSKQGVYSSDSTPFADKGIPAISFARISDNGYGPIHNRFDTLKLINKNNLKKDTEFVLSFAQRMANSFVIPVPKTMPDNMKEELDKYLGRK